MSNFSSLATEIIQPTFELARLSKEEDKFKNIVSEVKKIVHLVDDPKNIELITYICNLIENLIKDKYKIDKNLFFIKIYKNIFPDISEPDIQHILSIKTYLYNNNLIKKISFKTYVAFTAEKFIKQYTPN